MEELQLKFRLPKALASLWANRAEIGRRLQQHLIPNLGSVVLALVLFWVTSAHAAPWNAPAEATASIPLVITYQGRLADPDGTPLDNTNPGLGMTFSLYDTDTGGAPLWTETHANVPVSEGLFSIRLGSQNPLSIDLFSGDRWLGIQVGTDPEMTPREQLNAVPFALQASSADMIDGKHASDFLNVTGGTLTGSLDVNTADGFSLGRVTFNTGDISTNPIIGTDGASLVLRPAHDSVPNGQVLIMDGNTERHIRFHAGGYLTINGYYDADAAQPMELRLQTNGAETGILGALNLHGNSIINQGAMVEANLQTPDELAADTIDRFSEGDVLCWGNAQLELCDQAGDPLVQAVADTNGKPIVIGAEVIHVLGPVQHGDLLVASDVPGYAMVDNDPQPGSVIAQALEDFEGQQGLIRAMIRKF